MDDPMSLLWRLQDLDQMQTRRLKERGLAVGAGGRERLAASMTEAVQAEAEAAQNLHRARLAFRQQEMDLGALEDYLKQAESRLYCGEVTNPKEISQLEQRVAEERGKRVKLEDQYLRAMEEVERLERASLAARQALEAARRALDDFDRESALRQEEEQRQDLEYQEARKDIVAKLPENLRARYDLIHGRHPGSALARIERGSCSGCHTALSQAEIERVARLPGIATCENCGRLLAPTRRE